MNKKTKIKVETSVKNKNEKNNQLKTVKKPKQKEEKSEKEIKKEDKEELPLIKDIPIIEPEKKKIK